jgi:hypothetical protein
VWRYARSKGASARTSSTMVERPSMTNVSIHYGRRLASGLKCLFLPRDYPATVVTPAINDKIVPASCPQEALSGS